MFPAQLFRVPKLPAAVALLGLLLAGCQGAVTVDLSSEGSADSAVSSVVVDVVGLEFQRTDGTTEKMEFSSATATDLVDLQQDSLRMFTDETLADGTYTGVRLLLEDNDDASVSRDDGRQFPLNVAEGDYTEIDFTVAEDDSSRESLALLLELRKSLTFNEDDDEYTLTPVLRSARTDEAAQIEGNVTITCPLGTSLTTGGAVYLFPGSDVEPNDIGSTVEPFATASVLDEGFSGQFTYALRFLPAGDYTIAVTCNGDDDEVASDDDVDFRDIGNVTVDESETLTRNFPD